MRYFNEIDKINESAKMNRSTENTSTAHTLDRYRLLKRRNTYEFKVCNNIFVDNIFNHHKL